MQLNSFKKIIINFKRDLFLFPMTFVIYFLLLLRQVVKLHKLKEKHKLNVFKSANISKFQVLFYILRVYSSHRNDVWSA